MQGLTEEKKPEKSSAEAHRSENLCRYMLGWRCRGVVPVNFYCLLQNSTVCNTSLALLVNFLCPNTLLGRECQVILSIGKMLNIRLAAHQVPSSVVLVWECEVTAAVVVYTSMVFVGAEDILVCISPQRKSISQEKHWKLSFLWALKQNNLVTFSKLLGSFVTIPNQFKGI